MAGAGWRLGVQPQLSVRIAAGQLGRGELPDLYALHRHAQRSGVAKSIHEVHEGHQVLASSS